MRFSGVAPRIAGGGSRFRIGGGVSVGLGGVGRIRGATGYDRLGVAGLLSAERQAGTPIGLGGIPSLCQLPLSGTRATDVLVEMKA